jgi:hypothetical protein
MLALTLDDFMVEFEEGSVKNVGPTTKGATAKLFHPDAVEARAFGDSQVKLTAEDGEGNEVQIALSPDQAAAVGDRIAAMRDESEVFE